MFKLDLENEKEPEITLPTSGGWEKKQENSRKHLLLIHWLCGSQQTVENSSRDGKNRPPYQPPGKPYAGQEATVWTRYAKMEIMDQFQIGKGILQGCILSRCSFNLFAEYIMWNAGLDEAQAGIKISRRNINNLRYADDTTFMAEREEELRASWWKWRRKVKKLS